MCDNDRLKDARNFVATLRQHGWELRTDGDRLFVKAPVDDPDAKALLREIKPYVIQALCDEMVVDDLWPSTGPASGVHHHCPSCNGILFRQDVTGIWRCQQCDPGHDDRVLDLADRIRNGRPPREARPWNRLVGQSNPPRPMPEIDRRTLADPIQQCRHCMAVRTLRGTPGSESGICFYCWSSGRN